MKQSIKQAAKRGDTATAKLLAKEIVRYHVQRVPASPPYAVRDEREPAAITARSVLCRSALLRVFSRAERTGSLEAPQAIGTAP